MANDIAPEMTDNEALRRILALADDVRDVTLERYDSIAGEGAIDTVVTNASPATREASELVVKRIVTSLGPDALTIKEDGVVVGLIPAGGGQWVSPLAGSGDITCSTAPTKTATIAIASYQKSPEE